ncbi:flagellin N-terminal helical domain-containing protein [Clostridium tunisiense]|uniref:flagellin N-terminal helical domain-containing protein n=1 Tax=Clostridium tunisiense TaxID=219748 RepID=UPI0003033F5F|nr:flagellin [Clostridium tunisiense]
MRIYHNLASMNLYRRYKDNLSAQSIAHGRVSSGLRVKTSKDDPNAMAESQKLKLQIRGLQMATRNMQDGISILQTADGAMGNIGESLQRVRELMVKASGVTTPEDKQIIQDEVNQMLEHINTVAESTEVNGVKLLNKPTSENPKALNPIVQIGAMADEKLEVPFFDLSTDGLKIQDVTATDFGGSLIKLDDAINKIGEYRGKYGAISNRLETTYNNTNAMSIRIEGAEAELTGADIAYEMMEYTRASLLVDSGIAMMAQTNKFPQDVLRILENIKSR